MRGLAAVFHLRRDLGDPLRPLLGLHRASVCLKWKPPCSHVTVSQWFSRRGAAVFSFSGRIYDCDIAHDSTQFFGGAGCPIPAFCVPADALLLSGGYVLLTLVFQIQGIWNCGGERAFKISIIKVGNFLGLSCLFCNSTFGGILCGFQDGRWRYTLSVASRIQYLWVVYCCRWSEEIEGRRDF